MVRLDSSIEIRKAAQDVFAYVTDPAQMPRWMSSVVAVTCIAPAVSGVGTIFRHRWNLLGQVLETTYEVLEWDPGRAFVYQSIAGSECSFVRSSFAPTSSGTQLTWRVDHDLLASFQQDMPLAVRAMQQLLDVDLLTLKAVLEHQEHATTVS